MENATSVDQDNLFFRTRTAGRRSAPSRRGQPLARGGMQSESKDPEQQPAMER